MTTDATPAQAQVTPDASAAPAQTTQTGTAEKPAGDPAPASGDTQEPAGRKTALTSAEAKPADGSDPGTQDPANKADSKDGESQDKDKPTGAPETYADFSFPENMEVAPEAMENFKAMAKEANLPQDMAQKFAEKGAEIALNAVENYHNSQVDAYAQKVEEWHAIRAKDPLIGGTEEAQIKALGETLRVVRAVGGEELVKALEETGGGDNPHIIKAFYKLKDMVGPDGKFVQANSGGNTTPKTPAQSIYPNNPTALSS